ISISTKNRNALLAAHYFEEMRALATLLKDDCLLVIALTYQGDAYQRKGDLTRAMKYLQAAYTHRPRADAAARGNCAQLLARVYYQKGESEKFKKKMEEAEEIAREIDAVE